MKAQYKFLLSILTLLVCILFGCEKKETVTLTELKTKEQPVREAEDIISAPEEIESGAEKSDVLMIHICGAVNKPGVYALPEGSRLYQAIEKAGGFLEEADQDFLNQAEMIQDGSRVYVPTKEEASVFAKEEIIKSEGLVNINTASREEFLSLPGIGSGKAESIIKYRTENGKFQTIEEIMNVEGIKEGLFEKIKSSITV